jgi:DNA-binding Xre family transcriptional regulator
MWRYDNKLQQAMEVAHRQKMKKKDLQKGSGISSSSVAKLGRNENVNTEMLEKICSALHCDVCDIMEMEDENNS